MSIHVEDFKWEPGVNDAEYIRLLQRANEEAHRLMLKATGKLVKMAHAGASEMSPSVYEKILAFLPRKPHDQPGDGWHGYWVNCNDEIMCPSEEHANAIADFFEDCGFDIMHTRFYEYDGADDQSSGWWAVYVDGQ